MNVSEVYQLITKLIKLTIILSNFKTFFQMLQN